MRMKNLFVNEAESQQYYHCPDDKVICFPYFCFHINAK